jgi:hypothetical protein
MTSILRATPQRCLKLLLIEVLSVYMLGCSASIPYQPTTTIVEEVGPAQAKERLEALLGRLLHPRLIDVEVSDDALHYRFPRDRTWTPTDRSTSVAKQLIFRDIENVTVSSNNAVTVSSRNKEQTATMEFQSMADAKMFADLLASFRARGAGPAPLTVATPPRPPSTSAPQASTIAPSLAVVQGPSTAPAKPSAPNPSPSPITGSVPAAVQPRRALVIGNAAYTDNRLTNPVNDATDLATLLRRLGFNVTLLANADKPTMEKAVDLFTRGVPRGSAGLFFFAGHGVQIDGVNYLIPIGARLEAGSDVKYHAVAADWVLARMDESGMDVKVLVLDACRNNPLGRSWTRALSRGLAVMETPQGALIAYATSPGKTASDGTGRNSPFTAQLLRELVIAGRDIEVALKAVRAGVQQTTSGEQIPWVASSMTGDFYIAR